MHIKPHKFAWNNEMKPLDIILSFFTEIYKGKDFIEIKALLKDYQNEYAVFS